MMNTGAFFSCIHEMNEPKTRAEVPPSVAPELLLPARPFSISSIHRQQGAMASAVWITDLRFASEAPTKPAKMRPASNLSSGAPNTLAVALAVRDLPVPGTPTTSKPLGAGKPYCAACFPNALRRLGDH